MSRQAMAAPSEEGQGLPVRHGDLVVVRGDGMPIYDPARIKRKSARGTAGNDDDLEKGDLYITFEIEMPSAEWLSSIDSKVRCPALISSGLSSCFLFGMSGFWGSTVFCDLHLRLRERHHSRGDNLASVVPQQVTASQRPSSPSADLFFRSYLPIERSQGLLYLVLFACSPQ